MNFIILAYPTFSVMKVGLAADHRGYELKEYLKDILASKGVEFKDYGTLSRESVDYPDICVQLCTGICSGEISCGVLICRSGIGMSIVANKFKGIRAGLCWAPSVAELAKAHVDINVLVLPADFLSKETAGEILDVFLRSEASMAEHHLQRRKKIQQIEDKYACII